MTNHTPIWMQDDSYSATDDRILLSAIWVSQGVTGPSDMAVTQHAAGANMSVDVAPGYVVILGTSIAGQHKYVCHADAINNPVITAAPGAGQSRNDIVVAQAADTDQDGSGFSLWNVVTVKGTAATTGTQVDPTLPATCVPLARVLVGPSVGSIVTGNITDIRPNAVMTNVLSGVPCARIYPTLGSTFANNTLTQVGNMTTDYAHGLTVSGNTIVLPAYPARWTISAMVTWSGVITSGNCLTIVRSNAAQLRTFTAQAGAAGFPGAGGVDDYDLPASAVIDLFAEQNVGSGGQNNQSGSGNTWLSIRLASR